MSRRVLLAAAAALLAPPTLGAQITPDVQWDVGKAAHQRWLHALGLEHAAWVRPALRLTDDSTRIELRGHAALDTDGSWRAGAEANGLFGLPRPSGLSERIAFYGQARVGGFLADAPVAVGRGLEAGTDVHLDAIDRGLVAGVSAWLLRRDMIGDVSLSDIGEEPVDGSAASLRVGAWQHVETFRAEAAVRWTQFSRRLPDPTVLQFDGDDDYLDVEVVLSSTRLPTLSASVGHRFGIDGGTWGLVEVGFPLNDAWTLALGGGRHAGAPELSVAPNTFISAGLLWRLDSAR